VRLLLIRLELPNEFPPETLFDCFDLCCRLAARTQRVKQDSDLNYAKVVETFVGEPEMGNATNFAIFDSTQFKWTLSDDVLVVADGADVFCLILAALSVISARRENGRMRLRA
jgi:hypothetical protein